jgi:ATP-dependent RNA helicase DHX57
MIQVQATHELVENMDMIRVDSERGVVSVDNWIHFRAPARIGVLVRSLRVALDRLLMRKVQEPWLDINAEPLVRTIVELVATDGDVLNSKA